jgi:CO/xanthine dehydrogenase Mo-binding subunit
MGNYQIIGKGIPRHDSFEKAMGLTSYAADYFLPGMLYGKVLRSRYPSARIVSIDTSKAERLNGVKAVLTARDVPKNLTVTRFGQTHTIGGGFEGIYRVLAEDKVHYMGEAVALVAAETEEAAEKALELIKVVYEPLPGVFDPKEAIKPGAPRVEEGRDNLISHFSIRKGDVEKGFQDASVVIERTYRVPFVDHAYIEPEAGVAWIDENGTVTIRVSTQVIEHFRDVAEILGLPHNKVRVIGTMVGGGFGGKEDITVEAFIGLLAWKTKRPVKMVYTREESILAHSKRHAFIMEYKTGANRDGVLTALKATIYGDAGAYVYLSPFVCLYSTVDAAGPYRIPNVEVDTYAVLTNNNIASANRGFGATQPCFAYESQMDEMAKALKIDPFEIRKRNYLKKGESLAVGQILDRHVALEETAEKVRHALGEETPPSGPWKVGKGIASGMTSYGRMMFLHDTSRAYVGVEMDGSITIRAGVQDVGGGQASSLCQIVAEVLGVSMEDIKIYIADTALTPLAGTTTATRQLYMSGNATLMAAREVRKTILGKAGEILGVDPERLDLIDREIVNTDGSGASLSFRDAVRACASAGLPLYHVSQFCAPFNDLRRFDLLEGKVFPDFTFGTHGAEVAVNEETGELKVLRLIACYDVGKAINPLSVEGQIEGGGIYGLGYALHEKVILEEGKTRTLSFSEYLIPTSLDSPDIEVHLIESEDGVGPFGAKGIGEPSVTSVAPAVVNAIADAVGARVFDLPATPEKIFSAMKAKR